VIIIPDEYKKAAVFAVRATLWVSMPKLRQCQPSPLLASILSKLLNSSVSMNFDEFTVGTSLKVRFFFFKTNKKKETKKIASSFVLSRSVRYENCFVASSYFFGQKCFAFVSY
jgi:hypothetical protein